MSNIRRFARYLKPSISLFIISIIVTLFQVALTLIIPIKIGDAIELMVNINQVDFQNIYPILLFILGALFIVSICTYLYEYIMALVATDVSERLRNDVMKKLNHVSISYIDTHRHGDLVSRVVSDIEKVTDGLLEGFKQLYQGLIMIIFTLVFMFVINWLLAIVVVFITPLSIFVSSYIAKHSHKYFTSQSQIKGSVSGYVLEMIENQKTIKSLGYQNQAIEDFDNMVDDLYKTSVKAVFMGATSNPSTRFINGIVYVSVGIVGAILFINNGWNESLIIGTAELSTFLIYSNQYTKPFNEVSAVVSELQTALASLKRIFDVLNQEDEIEKNDYHIDGELATISFSSLSFSYTPSRPLIEDFSFSVHKGEKIAIVGPTGCGKTTLINLLMRFYDPCEGAILVNDVDTQLMSRHDLRKHFGMVLQDTWIFEGTVYDNITYGNSDVSLEEVIEVCKKIHAHGFIKRLPNGYQTIVSEKSGLSQGERQLLTIARVMLTNPEIVILDEATSSIDTRTEKKISDAFNLIMEGKTSFIIAHRLSTIQNADVILVMKDGNIIETGNHDSLIEKHGFYYELYNSQFSNE